MIPAGPTFSRNDRPLLGTGRLNKTRHNTRSC